MSPDNIDKKNMNTNTINNGERIKERFKKALEEFYSHEALYKLYQKYYLEWITDGYIGNNLSLFEISMIDEKTSKATFLEFVEQVFTNEETFKAIYETFSPVVKEVFETVAWKGQFVIPLERRSEFFDYKTNYDLNKDLKDEFRFFRVEKDIKKGEVLTIDYDIVRVFRKFMKKPKDYYIHGQDELKVTLVNNNEQEFVENMDRYFDYYAQGGIQLSSSNKLLKESKTSMRKYCNITEYYNDSRELDFLKTETIALFFFLLKEKYKTKEYFNYENIKQVINDFMTCENVNDENFPYTALYLNYIKGTRNIWNSKENLKLCLETISGIIDEMGEGDVVSLQNINRYILYRDLYMELIDVKDAQDYVYINEANYERTKIHTYEQYIALVIEPFVRSIFFLLGTLGLFELYYNVPGMNTVLFLKNKYLSKYDGLTYVKMTKLGKYVFGKSDDFDFNVDNEEATITLDDERTIVTLIGTAPAKSMFLEKIGQKMTSNKYKVTDETFLKTVEYGRELTTRINEFKEKISSDLPEIWQQFFANLDNKVNSLEVTDEYTVIKLRPDKELVSIITRDARFRRLAKKGEGYLLIVKKENMQELVDLLREYNYYLKV